MGIEFLVCLFLATVLTGTRPITDMIQNLRGVEPAHLAKARLRAEREKERAASARAQAESRRVRPGEDKPTFGDVCRVYWGDAMADAIALHERRREQKRRRLAGEPPVEGEKSGLLRQIKDLLLRPVGEADPEPAQASTPLPDTAQPAGPQTDAPNRWNCPGCGLVLISDDTADVGTTCAACRTNPEPGRQPDGRPPNTEQGEDMPPENTAQAGGTATGDAHDLESAIHQCDLLEDDLTSIDTSLDVIDEAIDSAGTATELIEAFLTSKNVDTTTVGGMSAARDMLSAEHIKTLIDAIAAAKQGVKDTREALEAMKDGADEALQGADGSIVNGR